MNIQHPSKIRRTLSNLIPGVDSVPVKHMGYDRFDMTLVNAVYERTRGSIEFGAGSDTLYTRDGAYAFLNVRVEPSMVDPNIHVTHEYPAIGRYTQNSQFYEKDAIWKTRNEHSYRCFVTGCEFTFDLLFTPTGKSGAVLLFETFAPHFTSNAYEDAFDKRGLTRDVDVLLERIQEVVAFARSKKG